MSKLLITGASGLLGSNLILTYSDQFEVFAAYHQNPLETDRALCLQLDLTQLEQVMTVVQCLKPHWIIHCAAVTNVDYCELHPDQAWLVNVAATRNIAVAANSVKARLIYISTDSVFDGERGYYCEEDPPNPLNVYARTKLAGEEIVREISSNNLAIRTNIYGWNMQDKYCLAEWALDRLEKGVPINGFCDVYFSPILVNDLASIVLEMIKLEVSGVYHIGGAQRCSKYQFLRNLAAVFDLDPNLVQPSSVSESNLTARRPLDTSLCVCKVSRDLRVGMPGIMQGLHRFRSLRDTGYVAVLKGLRS